MSNEVSYRVHGTTDDTDTCEVCGKVELRSVIMLAVIEAGEETGELIYAGSTCAARKLAKRGKRVTASRVRDASAAAARVMVRAQEFADEMAPLAFNAYLKANWTYAQNFGVQAARDSYDELQNEIKAIRSGDIVNTRFARMLPEL
jgi:roadblock/LC7 domain-containing protein